MVPRTIRNLGEYWVVAERAVAQVVAPAEKQCTYGSHPTPRVRRRLRRLGTRMVGKGEVLVAEEAGERPVA